MPETNSCAHRAMRIRSFASPLLGVSLVLSACGGGDEGDAPASLPTTPANGGNTPLRRESAGNLRRTASHRPPCRPSCAPTSRQEPAASAISLPTQGATVTSATPVAAGDVGNTLGDYCQVRGTIAPVDPASRRINFAVNLPETWNNKTIQFGGGGFNGTLIDGTEQVRFGPADKPAPLALGYATFGDDGATSRGSITDGTFATNDEQLANYGGQSLKKTRDVAQALIQRAMASRRKSLLPRHLHRRARRADRHPALAADYDGVIANEPALNYTGTRLSTWRSAARCTTMAAPAG
jgi:hypothetical protein